MTHSGAIVVGMDFSACSISALSQAVRIGAWNRTPVHALHVIDTLALVELEQAYSPLIVGVQKSLELDAREAWARLQKDIPGTSDATFAVVTANPMTALVVACREHNAGLLVLGMHGPSSRAGVGALAGRCVRAAESDVLLIAEGKSGPFKRIVVGIDFSEHSRAALAMAMRFAAQDGSEVHAIHVFKGPWAGLQFRPHPMADDPGAQAKYRDLLRANLEAFCRPERPEMQWTHPRFELVEASSHGSGIAEYLRTSGADLVMLGTRGKTNLRDVFLGSTAERVVRDSPCSVLAIRAKD